MVGSKVVDWWGNCVFLFLCISVALLGIGPVDLSLPGGGFSAWSMSRTCFFFWLLWKILIGIVKGSARLKREAKAIPLQFVVFLAAVTVSLLPTFYKPGDYRYFFFGCMHFLMVLDFFSDDKRNKSLILLMLALLPGVLVVRGLLHDPTVLNFNQMVRYEYPLDHANTAGYLLSMSLPLCFASILLLIGWRRFIAIFSALFQGMGLILTYSRGAWLGITAAMFVFALATQRYKEMLSAVVMGVLCVVLVSPVRERVVSVMDPQRDEAIAGRMRRMTNSAKLGLDHPVLGLGYGRGRLKEHMRERYTEPIDQNSPVWHSHNVYVELFTGTGLVGLGSFLWFLGEAFRRTLARCRSESVPLRIGQIGLLAALTACVVTGLGDVPFYHHETRIYFFTLTALAYLPVTRRDRSENTG